jgi:hypothetical protein
VASPQLGKVDTIKDIRQIWPDEAKDFTSWLATEDGLKLLGQAVHLKLELVQREAKVGPFSADLLARVVGRKEDHLVVVENQFGKADHDHFGKLLTYASGLKAKTVVWIAESFTDEHRQALDWINETAGERVAYFGLEVYVIKIGSSDPAPQFRLISSPNPVAQAFRESRDEVEFTETRLDQQTFWEELREFFKLKGSDLPLRKPLPQHWYEMAVGRSNFTVSLTINTRLNRIGCELYMSGPRAKQAFGLLQADKVSIESELGFNVEWQVLEGKDASRIATYHDGSIQGEVERQEAKEWLYSMADRFHKVFSPRVKALKLPQEAE